jgi:hypothetical protein
MKGAGIDVEFDRDTCQREPLRIRNIFIEKQLT